MCMMNNRRPQRGFRSSWRGRRANPIRYPNNERWNSNQFYRDRNTNESRYYENYREAREDNYFNHHFHSNAYNSTRTNFHRDAVDPRLTEFEQSTSSVQQNQQTSISNITNETNESKVPVNKPNIHIKFPNPWMEENENNLNSSNAASSSETNILNEDTENDIFKVKIEKVDEVKVEVKEEKVFEDSNDSDSSTSCVSVNNSPNEDKVEEVFEDSNDSDSSTSCVSVNNSPNIIDVYDSDEFLEHYPDTVPSEISSTSNNTNTDNEICISNLPPQISEADLRTFYERYGEIKSIRLIHNYDDRRGTYCLVVFNNAEDAIKSVETNGLYYEKHNLQVKLFSSKSTRHIIHVTNCPEKTTVEDLYNVFESCGPVERVILRITKRLKCDARISFEMKASVELAILLNNFKIRDRRLYISQV